MTASDPVHHPSHYGAGRFGCECIDVTRLMPFTVGNAVKYIWRHAEKNGIEDLRKALVYLDWAVEDQTSVAINTEARLALMRLVREQVRPHLPDIDPVYGAIYRISLGHSTEARILIERAIEGGEQ